MLTDPSFWTGLFGGILLATWLPWIIGRLSRLWWRRGHSVIRIDLAIPFPATPTNVTDILRDAAAIVEQAERGRRADDGEG